MEMFRRDTLFLNEKDEVLVSGWTEMKDSSLNSLLRLSILELFYIG